MSHTPHPPESGRDLLRRLLAPIRELMNEPLPAGVNFFQTTGSLCLFMAAIQMLTGVLMAFYYVPSPDAAWESIRHVDEEVSFGRIIHGLHHWGSSGFVVAVFIHMLRVFAFGAYKGHRAWTWVIGVGLFLVVMGFGFTGYLLPWDMKAYFGTQVGTNIVGTTPGIGPHLRRFLLGGSEISPLTLPRFYALHVMILPAALIGLMGAHLFLIRLFGITPPWRRDDEPTEYPETFFPNQALRDALVSFAALLILMALAWFVGGNLEEKADPQNSAYAPHPEWYFLGLQQLLRYFPGKYEVLGTFVIPTVGLLLLVLVPFIDRNPERRLRRRPIAALVAVTTVTGAVALTVMGYSHLQVERAELAKSAAAHGNDEAPADGPTAIPPPSGTAAAAAAPSAVPAHTASASSPTLATASAGLPSADPALVSMGAHLYQALECAKCHIGEKVGKDLNIPPALDHAGDRFTESWMADYLLKVPHRRYASKGKRPVERMPNFNLTDQESRALTAHMAAMRRADLFDKVTVDLTQSTPEKIENGRLFYDAESCGVCHALNGSGGRTAPDLTGVGSRLHPKFIFGIIKFPQSIIPETAMEDTLLEDDEVAALTLYLMEQK